MAENNRPVSEPLQKTAQAANAVRGAVKTGKAIRRQNNIIQCIRQRENIAGRLKR